MTRESDVVELVAADGSAIGESTVDVAHRPPGGLHRAFSVLLLDTGGRTLLQQRAATKTRFPLRWANSCCGHPAPGQSVVDAATRRLGEEIGVRAVALTEIGVYVYHAEDPATGRVEHEYDHVLLGVVPADVALAPDPSEVVAVRWVGLADLADDVATEPLAYAPWLPGVVSVVTESGALSH